MNLLWLVPITQEEYDFLQGYDMEKIFDLRFPREMTVFDGSAKVPLERQKELAACPAEKNEIGNQELQEKRAAYAMDLLKQGEGYDQLIELGVDIVHNRGVQTAIEQKKKISFRYFGYAPDKTKLLRHDGRRYSVSPYALIWNNDAYYLIGYHDARGVVTRFRVDRITSMETLDEPSIEKPPGFDLSAFSQKSFPCLAAGTVRWSCCAE